MKIDNLEVEYIGNYGQYRLYAPTEDACLGNVLYLGYDGKYQLCDPFIYKKVMHYLEEQHPEDDEE